MQDAPNCARDIPRTVALTKRGGGARATHVNHKRVHATRGGAHDTHGNHEGARNAHVRHAQGWRNWAPYTRHRGEAGGGRAAPGCCFLTAAVACVPAGVVSVLAEPSIWRTRGCAGCCGGGFTVFAAHSPPHSGLMSRCVSVCVRPKCSTPPRVGLAAKGRTGDSPGPRQETATRRNVTQGVRCSYNFLCCSYAVPPLHPLLHRPVAPDSHPRSHALRACQRMYMSPCSRCSPCAVVPDFLRVSHAYPHCVVSNICPVPTLFPKHFAPFPRCSERR